MAKSVLLDRNAVIARLRTRFRNQLREWLAGGGEWPLRIPLGIPCENEARQHLSTVRGWHDAWGCWQGPGEVAWVERRWTTLGTQRLPEALSFASPAEVAGLLGEHEVWQRACARLEQLAARPPLRAAALQTLDVLTEWEQPDFERLVLLVDWLARHPASNLYIRQLPIVGLDSKWFESRRRVVGAWLRGLRGGADGEDMYAMAGLRRTSPQLHMRLLDPQLRQQMQGLSDIRAPVDEIAKVSLPIQRVFMVENLQTGLAFEDLPGAVVFMEKGYSVEVYGELPWLRDLPCYYWGDIDTHGFAILDRLRKYVPEVQSLLMDQDTLMRHRALWGRESQPVESTDLPRLNDMERMVFEGLIHDRWGKRIRLEQERIEWSYAWSCITQS